MKMINGMVGLVVAGALGLTGCSFNASVGGASLDQADVEEEIIAGLTESVGIAPEDVDCTGISDIDVEQGETFLCTGTAPGGGQFDIDVTLTDDEGGFSAVVPE